jgi:hypothetical protein
MSKADTLLKKTAAFERLALYSDRKSFLQALAQTPQDPNRQLIWQALQLLQQAGVDESLTTSLANAVTFGRTDLAAIKQAIQSIIMTGKLSPLSQQPVINQLKTLMSQMKTPQQAETEAGMAGPADVTFKPDHIKAFPPIDKGSQQAIYDFVVSQGLGVPGKIDGSLGPDTRKAIEAIKGYFAKLHPQNPRMSDQEAIRAAKFKGR